MLDHVRHCFRNPERVPRVGELTHTWQTGRSVTCPGWHYGVESSVYEWYPHETMPTWWPGEGKIWDGSAWRDVPGYRKEPAPPGHMHPGGAPPRDVWPALHGVPLDEVKPAHLRLAVLEREGEEEW